ncbi:MAG: radical SAM/SPASM family putative metalloenzyme maturase [Desulfobulbaceae bacterium]|nr:radical SAM/SPASM family putative metalloenzyme maturase [Desulfobulbaceae bacterium]
MHSLYPKKVYVELTTRCNLQCPMCLKFSEGSCIEEGDLPLALFKKLAPSLAHTEFLVLNGIGEPLLHPDLEEIIAIARAVMPADGRIGFQSNGLLFNQARALGLIEAGLDTVCLSLDNLDAGDAGNGPNGSQKGHQFTAVKRALAHLLQAREMLQKPVRLGIEVVLQRKTLHQLQGLVAWAGAHQIDFIIASHLFSYDGSLAEQSLFNPNSYEATELFAKWAAAAQAQGLQLADLPAAQRKFYKNPAERLLVQLGEAMWQEAREKNIDYHFANLVAQSDQDVEEVEACFHQAQQSAQQGGIDLFLPPLHAQANGQRSCSFIEDEAIFIDTKGKVMPCHFLWHTCPGQVNNGAIQVEARVLGSITEEPLETIWQKETAAAFRAEAGKRDYAPCWSCTSAPCADLVNDNLLGMHDCYGSHVPCGHCMWAIGWLKCL